MSRHEGILRGRAQEILTAHSRADFASSYPEGPHVLRHGLHRHPLLDHAALTVLAEALPDSSVTVEGLGSSAKGDSLRPGRPAAAARAIRAIAAQGARVTLRDVERKAPYAALVQATLEELSGPAERKTGGIEAARARLEICADGTEIPFRFRPRHYLLFQLHGSSEVTLFPPGDPRFPLPEYPVPRDGGTCEDCEVSGVDGAEAAAQGGQGFSLRPGMAIYVPVMAPYRVATASGPSTVLELGWHSAWSRRAEEACAFNGLLRRCGLGAQPPARWPARNRTKAIAWRAVSRIPGIR